MSSAPTVVRSKPIQPLHLHIPKQPNYPVGGMEYYGPQGYRPEPYPPSALYNIPSGASSHIAQGHQHPFRTWPRNIDVRGNRSTSLSASQALDNDLPAISSPEPYGLQDDSRSIYEGLIRQPIRKRTAQACEKCRNRKTKCSGERPACQRCAARGLICSYSGGRVRGPSKSRLRPSASASEIHFASDNLKIPSLDLLPKTPQRLRHVSAMLPSSSPIHSASPLLRSPPFYGHAGTSKPAWRDTASSAHHLRRVQSHAPFAPSADQIESSDGSSCDFTLHGRPTTRGVNEPSFLTQLFGGVDHLNDYGSSSGSEPPSATQSHFTLPDSPERENAGSLLLEPYSMGRTATPINVDSYSSSPGSVSASLSASSASSPSSGMWSADIDHLGVLTGTDIHNAGTTNSVGHSQALHDYLAEMLHGDASGMMGNRIVYAESEAQRKRSPNTTYVSQYLSVEPPEGINGGEWDGYTLPH